MSTAVIRHNIYGINLNQNLTFFFSIALDTITSEYFLIIYYRLILKRERGKLSRKILHTYKKENITAVKQSQFDPEGPAYIRHEMDCLGLLPISSRSAVDLCVLDALELSMQATARFSRFHHYVDPCMWKVTFVPPTFKSLMVCKYWEPMQYRKLC